MDISYIIMALEKIKSEDAPDRHFGTTEALDWTIGYLEANRDDIDDLLDEEEEEKNS